MSVLYIRGADGTFQPVPSLQGESVSPLTIYPVGSVYISVSETSPASLFGGTWERIKDTFLLAAGDSYTAGSTGGEATHTLTETELPSISGSINFHGSGEGGGTVVQGVNGVFSSLLDEQKYAGQSYSVGATSIGVVGLSFGSGLDHNNMPPYLTVYMWRRIT